MIEFDEIDTKIVLYVTTHSYASTRVLAEHVGRSLSVTYMRMCRLRRLGLIDWEDNKDGTLHTRVRPVPLVGRAG